MGFVAHSEPKFDLTVHVNRMLQVPRDTLYPPLGHLFLKN